MCECATHTNSFNLKKTTHITHIHTHTPHTHTQKQSSSSPAPFWRAFWPTSTAPTCGPSSSTSISQVRIGLGRGGAACLWMACVGIYTWTGRVGLTARRGVTAPTHVRPLLLNVNLPGAPSYERCRCTRMKKRRQKPKTPTLHTHLHTPPHQRTHHRDARLGGVSRKPSGQPGAGHRPVYRQQPNGAVRGAAGV